MKLTILSLSAATLLGLSTFAFATDYKLGDLTIEHPVIRATIPTAKVAGGFMIITNTGDKPDILIGGSATFAGKFEVHEMKVSDGIMRMRKLQNGLEIPAGGSVHLKPGSYHVMFMKLQEQMKTGEKRKAIVEFKNAGKIEIEFDVDSIAKTMKHGAMDHDKKKHGEMKKQSN